MEEYTQKLQKNVTASTTDFIRDEETGVVKVLDNATVVVGGMISDKTVKFTKNNQAMAFIELEDMTGSVEVIVFPKTYEKYQHALTMDNKIFVVGRATIEDEQNGKIISERIVPFEETCKELWLQFATMNEFQQKQQELFEILRESDGMDEIVVYVANPKSLKRYGKNYTVDANPELLAKLYDFLGEKKVKCVEKNIENKA